MAHHPHKDHRGKGKSLDMCRRQETFIRPHTPFPPQSNKEENYSIFLLFKYLKYLKQQQQQQQRHRQQHHLRQQQRQRHQQKQQQVNIYYNA